MSGLRYRSAVHAVIVIAMVCVAARTASAQKYSNVGRGKCFTGCHDHDAEKEWSEKKDGPPPDNHLNALKQMNLNGKNADATQKYAKALGIADPYDPATSTCLKCHATIVKGEPTGVYCETCHGPASGYLEPHKEKGAYQKSVAVGLNDIVKKPAAWAAMCMKCHVMDDQRLIAAGHKSGDDFDLGAKFSVVMVGHWKSTYSDKGQIAALGKAEAVKLVAARKGAPAAIATAPAAAPPTPTPPPAAPVPAAAAPPAVASPPAVSPPPAAAPRPAVTPQPQPTPSAPQQTAPPVPRTAPRAPQPAPAPPPQIARAPDIAPGLPPTMATPPPPPSVPEATPGSALAIVLPPSPTAAVAAIQGRVIALLESLLRRGGRAPIRVTPPERKTEYRGPDADLLRLQEEVLMLAIEALKTAPPSPKR